MFNEEFAYLVLSIVSEVPYGKVASYSQIASLAGYPKNARQVGKILSNSEYFGEYPCHRIIHSDGRLVNGWESQASLLEGEGIIVIKNKVDMKKYQF